MNRKVNKKQQPTLFQTWATTSQKQPQKNHVSNKHNDPVHVIELCSSDEDDLLVKALEVSVAQYEATKDVPAASSSSTNYHPTTSKQTPVEVLPGFDVDAGHNWVYPTNYPLRDYQFTIVHEALFKNTMVILPTGLGKTFIAAVVMYNFFRWYPRGKIVFMAPTKPLVAQQIEACFNIMGIPLEESVEMTGATNPTHRKNTWKTKRVFFITPHVMSNDLAHGICPAEDVKLLVFDEAHKARGNYAYCQVINEVVRYTDQFRVLALSATPGNDAQAIQQVLGNLLIAHVEFRTETSIDIQPYTFERTIDKKVVKLSDEMQTMINKILGVIEPIFDCLCKHNAVYRMNVADVRPFLLLIARQKFRQTTAPKIDKRQLGLIEGEFALCTTLSHAYEMLLIYGMRSFYNFMHDTLYGQKGTPINRAKLSRNSTIIEIMDELTPKFDTSNSENIDDTTSSHPKLDELSEIVRDHFVSSASRVDGPSNTRVMVFSAFRDSVVEITNLLNKHKPLIRAMSFTGQATSSNRSKGITQKEQIAIVKQFRSGNHNTLVATCVGEEGLDIGDVDLIVCFDAYKSPVRTIQRMGRTGRKRQGRVVLLTTEGREEQLLYRGQAKTQKLHTLMGKTTFDTLYAGNPRMIPKGFNPECSKLYMTVAKYQVTGKRKKKSAGVDDKDTSKLLMEKFLAKYRKKIVSEDDSETNDVEKSPKVKKVKDVKTKTISKPCRITKKQRAAFLLDDSSDDAELLKETFKIDSNELPNRDVDVVNIEAKSNNADDDWDSFEFDNGLNIDNPVEELNVKERFELEEDLGNQSVDADNFFALDEIKENDYDGNGEYLIQDPIRSPPALTDVFDASKLSLSPINLNEILGFSDDEREFHYSPVRFHDENVRFERKLDSPERSPVITKHVKSISPVNHKVQESTSIYSTTQLIEMVQHDSVNIEDYTKIKDKVDDNVTDKNEISDMPNDELNALFDLNFKFDDDDDDDDWDDEVVVPDSMITNKNNFTSPVKPDVKPEKSEVRVSFDLNFDFSSFMDDEDVKKIDEKCRSPVEISDGFSAKVLQTSTPINGLRKIGVSKQNEPSPVGISVKSDEFSTKILHTSTPLNGIRKIRKMISPDGDDFSDSESFIVPKAIQPKRQVMAAGFVKKVVKEKKQRKRRLQNEFVQSQADVLEDDVTSDESENSSLDEMDSSFIDDLHQTDKSMSAVYLKSVKDVIGPKKFKLQYEKRQVIDTQRMSQDSMENDTYEFDEFCVPNDEVEYTTSQGNDEISDLKEDEDEVIGKFPTKKSRKRIISVLNSSTEDEDVVEKQKHKTEISKMAVPAKQECETSNNFRKPVPKIIKTTSVDTLKTPEAGPSRTVTTLKTTQAGPSWKSDPKPNFAPVFDNLATPDKLTLLIDSRELNGIQGLVSVLRHQYKVNTTVAKLCGCDYVVSARMGVERKILSDVANSSLRLRLVERLHTMSETFDRTCLIIEKDRDKVGAKSLNSNYFFRLISGMLQLSIKILHSNSQDETASILKELAAQEQTKGFGISIDVNLTKKEETLCRIYQKIPSVSYITALHLCKNFHSFQQVANSNSFEIQEKAVVTEERANRIVTFLRQNFK